MAIRPLQFLEPEKRYVLVNSTDEWITFQWKGQVVKVPPKDKADPPLKHAPHKFHSYDIRGTLIPGTLLVWDIREPNVGGGYTPIWSCEQAIREKLGVSLDRDGNVLYANQTVGARGISVVPWGAEENDIEDARLSGQSRWKQWQHDLALYTVQNYDRKNAILEKHGKPPDPDTPEVMKARLVVSQMREAESDAARERLGIGKNPEEKKPEDLVAALLKDEKAMELLRVALQKAEPEKVEPKAVTKDAEPRVPQRAVR